MGDCLLACKLSHYVTGHPGQLSLAIPPCVGAMSNGDTTTAKEENGEFCVAVAHATRTADILAQFLLDGRVADLGHYTGLISVVK